MIGGTTGRDAIALDKSQAPGDVKLTLEARDTGDPKLVQNLSFLSRIEVYGGNGDDEIKTKGDIGALPVLLDGGPGNDYSESGVSLDRCRSFLANSVLVTFQPLIS